jgi:hypothetical protein
MFFMILNFFIVIMQSDFANFIPTLIVVEALKNDS